MYYYILEAPQSRGARQTYQRLRDILTNLGIGGELVTASPARSPAELAQMGLNRGYTTIVAVGGDEIISEVATAVLGQAVLGIIPLEASPSATELIGTTNLKEAAESLKMRRLLSVNTVLVSPDTHLFLPARISTEKLAKLNLVIDNRLKAFSYFNQLSINRDLEIKIESIHHSEPRKILGLFKVGGEVIRSESLFHGRSLRLLTDPALPVKIGARPITTTPITLRLVPESLKVITRRGTLVL